MSPSPDVLATFNQLRADDLRVLLWDVRKHLDEGVFFLTREPGERERGIKLLDRLAEAGFGPHSGERA